MQRFIDVRSDTVTRPTPEMRAAMAEANVGDDVYRDDPTMERLQARAAEMLGKEAALFVASGTMGNQLAIMTHTTPGDEMILGAHCHIIAHEVGAAPRLSGVGYALVDNPDNRIRPEDVKSRLRPKNDLHTPVTTLLCLENALADGNVVPVADLKAAYDAGKENDLSVHLDGARIFNAAVALGVGVREVAVCGDSVMLCLSKGLCAPVGSLLCGTAKFIDKARKYRKMLGGGMRQAGVLAAAGLIALEKMTKRLREDHDNAKRLADLLAAIPGVELDRERVKINMVFWRPTARNFSETDFIAFLLGKGIKANGLETATEYRFVVHNDVSREDCDRVVAAVRKYVATL